MIDHEITVISRACPLFVPLAEEGWLDGEVTRLTVQRYLNPLREKQIDTLVLGCTHYPLLEVTIREIMGEEVYLVNSAKETAKEVQMILNAEGLAAPGKKNASYQFYVTDNVERFITVGERFLGRTLEAVELVS
jgi:glutamate racemase